MHILFCLHDDIYGLYLLKNILPSLIHSGHTVSAVGAVAPRKSNLIMPMEIIDKVIPFQCLSNLPHNILKDTPYHFENYLDQFKITYHKVNTINDAFGLNLLQKSDLVLSLRFPLLFKQKAINTIKNKYGEFKLLNLHSAALPDYQGLHGTLQAILHHEKEIGMSLHTIPDETIDTGRILHLKKIKTDHDSTYFTNLLALYQGYSDIILDVVNKLENKEDIKTQTQNPELGQYFSFPTDEDMNNFKKIMPFYNETDIQTVYEILADNPLPVSEKKKQPSILLERCS